MANRQTKNVSLTPEQDAFVQAMVDAGRYRTASEVVRDGLRLLEETEHRRLLEKWLYEGLSDDELKRLPSGLAERVRSHFRRLVEQGLQSGEKEGWIPADEVMARLASKLASRLDEAT